jgi:hypothetical protein
MFLRSVCGYSRQARGRREGLLLLLLLLPFMLLRLLFLRLLLNVLLMLLQAAQRVAWAQGSRVMAAATYRRP